MNWNEATELREPSDLVGQPGIEYDLGLWEHTQKLPDSHLLFVGPPGTGKTSTARLIARMMLSEGTKSINYHETNGSDDRGIDFIRGVFKTAMKTKPIGDERKILVIDEADGLTTAAQDAMRQLMEDYKSNCLVILTANEQNKIRPAIQSRCKVYNFRRVLSKIGAGRLWDILKKTDHPCLKEWSPHLERVVELHDGDMRACLNLLGSLEAGFGSADGLLAALRHLESIAKLDGEDIEKILTGEWRQLQQHLYQSLRDGTSLRSTMHALYDGLQDYTEDTFFDAMVAYGDVMTELHEWPGNDYSFCDYMVAAIRRETR
jgi:DNA polymerase III delta prime subunit